MLGIGDDPPVPSMLALGWHRRLRSLHWKLRASCPLFSETLTGIP
jgi:hypothetical protein